MGSTCHKDAAGIVEHSLSLDDEAQHCLPSSDDESLGHRLRGVSVHHLSTEFPRLMSSTGLARTAAVYEVELPVIRAKGKNIMCPRDRKLGAAYVDCIGGDDHAGISQWMLSYTWGYKVDDIIDTLVGFCKAKGLDVARTYIWICCLCVNQWRVQEARDKGKMVSFSEFQSTFQERVQGIGKIIAMMAPWRDPRYIKRAWCVFEMFTAHSEGLIVEVAMPPAEAEDFERCMHKGSAVADIWPVLSNIGIQNAAASVQEDKERILALVTQGIGCHALNSAVSRCLKQWTKGVAQNALHRNDQSTTSSAKLLLEIAQMRFLDGELHEAVEAARCSSDILKTLGELETDLGAKSIRMIGRVKYQLGNLDGALQEYKLATQIRKLTNTLETPDSADLFMNIGLLKKNRGDPGGALREYEYAKKIRELTNTLETPPGALLIGNIGYLKAGCGDLDGALLEYEHARQIRELTNTMTTPEGALLIRGFGDVKEKCGDLSGALEDYKNAKQIRELTNILETPDGANVCVSIGNVKKKCGDLKGAMQEYEQAKRIRELTNTLETPDGADLFMNIGLVKKSQGDLEGALQEYEHAKHIRELTNTLGTPSGDFLMRKISKLLIRIMNLIVEGDCGDLHPAFQARKLKDFPLP